MESTLTQIQIPPGHSLDEWNEAYRKVETYLAALRLRNKFLMGQYVYRILFRATARARSLRRHGVHRPGPDPPGR